MEHLAMCPFEGTVPPNACEWCRRERTPCWVADGGYVYHAHSDCPTLPARHVAAVTRTTMAAVMGRYDGCAVCVYGFCTACAAGRHEACSPKQSPTGGCSCADRRHRAR